jgi:hypothetical protein
MPFIKVSSKDGETFLIPIDRIADVYCDKDGRVTIDCDLNVYDGLEQSIDEIYQLIEFQENKAANLTSNTPISANMFASPFCHAHYPDSFSGICPNCRNESYNAKQP